MSKKCDRQFYFNSTKIVAKQDNLRDINLEDVCNKKKEKSAKKGRYSAAN